MKEEEIREVETEEDFAKLLAGAFRSLVKKRENTEEEAKNEDKAKNIKY